MSTQTVAETYKRTDGKHDFRVRSRVHVEFMSKQGYENEADARGAFVGLRVASQRGTIALRFPDGGCTVSTEKPTHILTVKPRKDGEWYFEITHVNGHLIGYSRAYSETRQCEEDARIFREQLQYIPFEGQEP